MPESEVAQGDRIMIRCPACGTTEAADPAVLADSPMIVCRKCGDTWPAAPRRRTRAVAAEANESSALHLVDAERRPLVTFSGRAGQAWATKREGDILATPPVRSSMPFHVTAVASALFLAIFLGGREAAVAVLPDLAGLYSAIGLRVNLYGLEVEAVEAERNSATAIVRGVIRNISSAAQPVPALTLTFRSSTGAPAGWRSFDPPGQMIAAGEAAPFALEIDDAPPKAENILIKFRGLAEDIPENSENPAQP